MAYASQSWVKDLLSKVFKKAKDEGLLGGIYSEEEQIVGKWIDGRPIYRKVYPFTDIKFTSQTWTTTSISYGIPIDELGQVVNSYAIEDGNAIYYLTVGMSKTSGKIIAFSTRSSTQTLSGFFICEYTKTTD